MTREERRSTIEHIKKEACTPKHRLMELLDKLIEIGAVSEAKSLESIIWKLEVWQNR
ncbi:MAG: hypothetical protein J6S14_12010 [Clostridia bacterium]|nr:hypothetical protein [Clostridia bacterium]